MVIVAGHLVVESGQREGYLSGCVDVVEQARRAPGCLDFSISADLVEPGRVNIFERWESQEAVESFAVVAPATSSNPRSSRPASRSTTWRANDG